MEFKGTKGEWVISDHNTEKKWINISSEKGVIIRTFYGNAEPIVNDKESEANAKLIASAPNLLEALQSMTFIFESLADKLPSRVEDFNCYQDAKKAINKALGL